MLNTPAIRSCVVLGLAIIVAPHTGQAATIRVPEDQPTIQEAINVAADGDTIDVAPGIYILPYTTSIGDIRCSLVVDKSLTLKSRELYQAFLDGQGDNTSLVFIGAAAHIEGFVLQNTARGGIEQGFNSSSWTARNLMIRNVHTGIQINDWASRIGTGSVSNITVASCTVGLATNDADGLDVRNCLVMNCDTAFRGHHHNFFTVSYSALFNNNTNYYESGYYSDISVGPGVIEVDPLLVNEDVQADGYVFPYFPTCASPLVDAGDPDPSFYDVTFPVSLGTQRNDIGAYGGPGAEIELSEQGRQDVLGQAGCVFPAFVEVPSTSPDGGWTPALEAGESYRFVASGTWIVNQGHYNTYGTGIVDAEWGLNPPPPYDPNAPWEEVASGFSYTEDVYDLVVDDVAVDWLGSPDGVNWAPHVFSPDHVYQYYYTGAGATVHLYVSDHTPFGPPYYGDNTGTLHVEIQPVLPLGPRITGHSPSGVIDQPVSYVDVTFNEDIDPNTITVDDVEMTGPEGPIAVDPPVDQGGNVWRIGFPEQSADGEYHVYIGPHIEDLDGNEMDQDGDGVSGEEPDDVYDASFAIAVDFALEFDGNDRCIIPNAPSLNPSEITVECWVNFARLAHGPGYSGTDSQFPLCKGGDRTSGAYRFQQGGTGPSSHWLSFSIGEYWNGWGASATAPLETDRWYHMAGTYDGQMLSLYLDGILLASNDVGSIPVGNGSPLYLSYDDVGGFPYFLTGQMDEVRIWSYARREDQIAAAMYHGLNGQEPGLVGYWRLDEGSGQVISDLSIYRNDGQLGSTLQEDGDDPTWVLSTAPTMAGLWVTAHNPSGVQGNPVSYVGITFSREINPNTFAVDDIEMTGPDGPIAVDPPEDQGSNVWGISFAEQSTDGEYHVYVGPHIEDVDGNEMDQDGDEMGGEDPDDIYDASFIIDLTPPEIITQTPSGEVDLPVDHIDVTFSEEVTDAPCDPNDIALAGPEGNVPVDAPVDLGNNVWRFSFDQQTMEGNYTLTIAPCFEDLAGNPMAEPYVGSFTIALPDLACSDLAIPPSGYTGGQIDVSWRVTNVGGVVAGDTWQDCVYLSDDNQPGGDTQLTCVERPNVLDPNDWYEQAVQVTVPGVEEGDYWIIVEVDDANSVYESDEDNNVCLPGPITIRRPNLTISPDLVLPVEGWTGRHIDVGWTVTNTGEVPAEGSWQDCVYLSDDQVIGDDHPLGCKPNPVDLDPNDHYDRVGTFTITDVPEGEYWIVVCADDGNTLPETEETDNCTYDGPLWIYVTPCADLYLDPNDPNALVIPSDPVAAGGTAYVDWVVTNIGDGATNASFWYDRIYLSLDQTLDGGDRAITPDFQNPMALNPGEAYWQSVEFTVPGDLTGDYYVIVEADARNNLGECNEGNNVIVSDTTLRIDPPPRAPVLTMTACDVDADPNDPNDHPWPGDEIIVTWTITNTGEMPTGPFTIDHAIVFSEDEVLDPPPGDEVLAWHVGEYSGDLDAGEESEPISATVNIPLDVWGAYYIIVWPDPPLWVDLDRSPCSAPIAVQAWPADLELQEVGAPSTGYSGQPIDITWSVENYHATQPTHVSWWDDKVYLSADEAFDPNDDVLIGTFRHNGDLGPYEGYVGPESGTVVLPDDVEDGLYYVFVHVDADDRVYEVGEENNVGMAGPIEVTYAPPDLVVDTVTVLDDGVPAGSVLSGTTVSVEWEVNNTGDGATSTDSWFDRIHISTDDTLEIGSDPVLGTVAHYGVLDPNDWYPASQEVTIPIELSGPDVYMFVCTDYANEVFESDDANNCGVFGPFEVVWGPADLQVQTVAVAVDDPPASSGSPVMVEWTVINSGLGTTTTGSWSDRIYISTDDTLEIGSDPVLDTVPHSGTLDPNDVYSASHVVEIPIDFVGPEVYILVKTDHDNRVYESDDSNNVGSADPIEVVWGPPDLIVESISAPGGATAGQPLSLSWVVRNIGGPTTPGAWSDRVYLSADRWLSDDDTEFDPVPHSGDLAYDATYTANTTVDLPPELADQFYLIVETDSNDALTESDEANNTRYVSISLTPLPVDLQVTVDAPETALSGQNMQVTWMVANSGTGATPTGSWRDAVYLSPDQYLDPNSDHYLGYFDHSGILDPNDIYTRTEPVQIPNGLSGPYWVFVVTDINDDVYEENDSGDAEENNEGYDPESVDVVLPPPADLVVTDIVLPVPPSGTLGEDVTIQWTVENQGEFQAQGSWHDSVYISADTVWDIGDKRIGKVQHTGPLDPNDPNGYTESLTAPLPGVVPADYYIIVRTDIHNEVREIDGEENNTTASAGQITVDCWELVLGVPSSHELSTGTEHYFKIPGVPEGEDLLVWLDCDDDSASTELYVRYEAVPDRGHYDFAYSTPFAPDHEIVVPDTRAGTYYVLVRGEDVPNAPSGYTLGARLLAFEIRSITPSQAGNAGSVTVSIEGGQLSPDTIARLVAGETTITGTTWPETSLTQMFVTFDLSGAPTGTYDVEIEKPDEAPVVLAGAFEITAGTGPRLEVNLVLASSLLRPNTPYIVYVVYGNTGDADLPVPLFSVAAPEDVPLRLDPGEDPWPGPVQVLGISMDGPPGILRPGSWQQIPIYSQAPATTGPVEISLGMMVADATPIDWDEIEADLRPDDIPAELWAVVWANLITHIGSTWADFLQVMTDNATYLARVGNRTYDLRELFAVAVKEAGGDLSLRLPLAARVDAFSPAPGLPLAFVPVALNNLAQRFYVGPLGRGWSHNFEYSLTRLDDDTVLVSVPGGLVRPFNRQPDGSWQGLPGDFGVLEDLGGDTYRITEKDGLVWFFDPSGHLTYVEEPNGNRITLGYSGDFLVEMSHSNGQRFTLQYNPEGRIHWLTDHAGRQTEYLYDDATGERLVQVTAPGSRETFYDYNSATGGPADHALRSITFPDGTHRYYSYDGQGRLAEVSRDGGEERITFAYEGVGTIRLADAEGNVSTLRLGPDGELVAVQDALGNTLHLGYDQALNLTRLVAPDGAEYEFDYDSLGNLTESIDPLDAVISLGHTTDPSRLDWLLDARGNLMDFESDAYGNLSQIIYPDSSHELFGYDDRGTLVYATNRRDQTITYTHNADGLLTRKVYPASEVYPDGRTIDYGYDARGNLDSVADSLTGTITMQYDARDFLEHIEYPGGIWFTFEYNDAGWRTRRTGHDGYVLNYHYDQAGRLEALTDGDGAQIIQYQYDAVGRLIREDKGNGTYTTYEYDAAGQIRSVVNYAPDDSVQSRFDYTYDENGNPTSMATLDGTWRYRYDATGQLTDVTYPDGRHVTYEYDPAGNRITVTDDGVPTQYTTNELNQYTQVGDVTYGYDADGNMTSKTDATGTTTYHYDADNRLVRVVTPADGTWEYTYDGLGNRIYVTHDDVTTRYVHDPIGLVNVAGEYSSGGPLTARYTHAVGLVSRLDAGGDPVYYSYDPVGHTRQLTGYDGAVVNAYGYDPFGVVLHAPEAVPGNPFRYGGRFGVIHEANGLNFMRARSYDPSLGRFVSEDPLRNIGHNTYAYAFNNPLRFVDPHGRNPGALRGIIRGIKRFAVDVSMEGVDQLTGVMGDFLGYFVELQERDPTFGPDFFRGFALIWDRVRRLFTTGESLPIVVGGQHVPPNVLRELLGLDPPTRGAGSATPTVIGSVDPNVKTAPNGFGETRFVPVNRSVSYRVDFENLPDATAPAQQVRITDELSENLDERTFQLGEIAFGETVVEVPEHRAHYVGEVTLDNGLIVEINAGLDITTRTATWTLTAIDPATGEPPEDPTVGFLPPNDPETHSGEGYVTFTIRPVPGLSTGTEITNTATIIFDTNPPIETNEVFNTIDAVAPTSSVTGPSGEVPDPVFEVTWTDDGDDPGGSGVVSYSIYYRLAGGPYTLWLTTPDTSATFTAVQGGGAQYDFYSLATDGAGNTEAPPTVPDTTVTAPLEVPPAPTLGTATATTIRIEGLGSVNIGAVEHAVLEETTGKYVGADGRLAEEPFWQPLDDWAGLLVWALDPETPYAFKAKARNAGGETEFGPTSSLTTSIQGDVDGDGNVTLVDVGLVEQALRTQYGDPDFDPRADLNGDGRVTYADLGIVRRALESPGQRVPVPRNNGRRAHPTGSPDTHGADP